MFTIILLHIGNNYIIFNKKSFALLEKLDIMSKVCALLKNFVSRQQTI